MKRTRRQFLRDLGCGTLTATAVMAGVDHLFVMNALAADSSDYKALVCIFLLGGNDGNNTVIPADGHPAYAGVREALTIPEDALLPISPPSDGRVFGLHPSLPRLQTLFQEQRLAIVANVGPLLEPLTQSEYLSHPSLRPAQLFSHSDQQSSWQTAYARGPLPTGWGGRIADLAPVASSGVPTVASIGGVTIFSQGSTTSALSLPPAPTPLNTILSLPRPGDAAKGSAYRKLLNRGMAVGSPVLVAEAADVTNRAIAAGAAINQNPSLATAFPTTPLGSQLAQVAKLIKMKDQLGLTRQIFFCSLNGFDTHAFQGAETGVHASLLQQLNDAMGAFYDATVELGVPGNVTTFTMSDFGRTLKPAGGGAMTGSDHAWGGHQFVMGGAVAGGDFYGAYPTLALGGPDDSDTGWMARGRWIPTIAVNQYVATLALWFGVAPGSLSAVAPNIGAFSPVNLGFMV